jgi:hypothetical protein
VRVAASGRTPCPRGEGSGILLCALAADLSQQKLVAGRVDHDELLIAFGRHRLGAHALAWLGHHRTGPIIHDDPARNRAQVLVHYLRQDDGVDPDPVRLAGVLTREPVWAISDPASISTTATASVRAAASVINRLTNPLLSTSHTQHLV